MGLVIWCFLDCSPATGEQSRLVAGAPAGEEVVEDGQRKLMCPNCEIAMKLIEEKSRGKGYVLIIIGTILTFAVIGIPILLYGMRLTQRRKAYWVCENCEFQKDVKWFE